MADNTTTNPAPAGQNTPENKPAEPQQAVSGIAQNATQSLQGAQQGVMQAGQQAQQVAAQAKQTAEAAKQQAQQLAAGAQETAAQVGQQAQQLAAGATQTATQAQQLVKDLLMPKANQPKVTMEEKIWALVSYIPFVSLIVLIIKYNSKYILLHGRQGLVLSVLAFVNLFIALFPYIGWGLFGLIAFLIFVVSVFSAYQALIGNWWKIPVLGDIAEMIPVTVFAKATREALTGQIQDQNVQPPQTTQTQTNTDQASATPTAESDQNTAPPAPTPSA